MSFDTGVVREMDVQMTSDDPMILIDGELGVPPAEALLPDQHLERMVSHTRELFAQLDRVSGVLADIDPGHHMEVARAIVAWKKEIKAVFDFGQHGDPRAVVAAADDALNAALKPYGALLHAEDTANMLGLKYNQKGRDSVELVRRADFRYGLVNIVNAHVASLPNVLPGVGGRMVPIRNFDKHYN